LIKFAGARKLDLMSILAGGNFRSAGQSTVKFSESLGEDFSELVIQAKILISGLKSSKLNSKF
jgi:hypothetical protein